MNVLTAAPYNYVFEQLVKVRVTASNLYGSGPTSISNSSGATIRRVPDKMGSLSVTRKTENEIFLSWSALTGSTTGNSQILTYALYFDDNTGTTNIELDEVSVTNYIVDGLTGGLIYKLKVAASNIYGFGEFSDELSVLTSDVPD